MSNTTNTTRRYLPAELGLNKDNKPHAFHVEGFISRPPFYNEASGDKKAFLSTAIGINMSPAKMMALADGSYSKDTNYGEDSGFLGLKIFGKMAEDFSKICAVGVKVAVAGNLEWRDYTKKDQTPGKELVLNVSTLVVMGGKGVDPVISDNVGYSTRTYVKDGITHSQPMVELMSGRVVGCNGLKTSDGGKQYLTFGVMTKLPAEKIYDLVNGSYKKDKKYDDKKKIVNVTLFDRSAEAMAKVVRDGAEVVVTGPIEAREYEGSISYRVRSRQCSIMKFAPKTEGEADTQIAAPAVETAAEAVNTTGFSAIADDDDDCDLPF